MFHLLKKIKKYLINNISPDEAFRYKPLASFLKNRLSPTDLVIEFGSGDVGMSPYLKKAKITGLDTEFLNTRNSKIEKIIYDGKTAPFPDNYFNYAVSADCLEHVKPSERESFISEIFRITKNGILLIFPSGQMAANSDKILLDIFKKNHQYSNKYLEEHCENGLPDIETIKKYIEGAARSKGVNIDLEIKNIMNIWVRNLYIRPKFKGGTLGSIFYFLFTIFIPISSIFNFGDCYWKFINIKIKN